MLELRFMLEPQGGPQEVERLCEKANLNNLALHTGVRRHVQPGQERLPHVCAVQGQPRRYCPSAWPQRVPLLARDDVEGTSIADRPLPSNITREYPFPF